MQPRISRPVTFRKDTRGSAATEYLVLAALVAVCSIAAFRQFGGTVAQRAICLAQSVLDGGAGDCGGEPSRLARASGTSRGVSSERLEATRATPTSSAPVTPPVQCIGPNCGSDQCFVAGTLVAAADGLRPIEQLRPGDLVLSRDDISGAAALRPVVRTFVTEARQVLDVELVAPDGAIEAIGVTPEHPFWIAGRGWVAAGALEAGALALAASGDEVTVGGIAARAETATVYNLEVEELHTYFVGASRAWVHNQCLRPIGWESPAARPPDAPMPQRELGESHDEWTRRYQLEITVWRIGMWQTRIQDALQMGGMTWTHDNMLALFRTARARTDQHSRYATWRLLQELATSTHAATRTELLQYATTLPAGDTRSALLGTLFPSPMDRALAAPRLPQLQLQPVRPEPLRPAWDHRHAGAPPRPPPPPNPHVVRFEQGLRALALAQHGYRVDTQRVRQDLERLIRDHEVVRRHVREIQRRLLVERLGDEAEAARVAQQHAAYLTGTAFAGRLRLEGTNAPIVVLSELNRLDLLDRDLARATSLTLFARSELGQAVLQALRNGNEQARIDALVQGIQSLPGGAGLSAADRIALATALARMSPTDWANLVQGTGDAMNQLNQLSPAARNFLGRIGGAAPLLTVGGAAILVAGGGGDVPQLIQAGLNAAPDLGRFLLQGTGALSQQGAQNVGRMIGSVTGPLANGIGAFISGRDAMQAFAEGNTTSGAFLASSAVFSGAAAGLGLACLFGFGAANAWNPVGWVTLGLTGLAVVTGVAGTMTRDENQTMLHQNGWLLPQPSTPAPTLGPPPTTQRSQLPPLPIQSPSISAR